MWSFELSKADVQRLVFIDENERTEQQFLELKKETMKQRRKRISEMCRGKEGGNKTEQGEAWLISEYGITVSDMDEF